MNLTQTKDVFQTVGAILGILSFIYLLVENKKKNFKISFDSKREQYNLNEDKLKLDIDGILKNNSKNKNTITRFWLFIFDNEKNSLYDSYSIINPEIKNNTGETINFPILMNEYEAIDINLKYNISIDSDLISLLSKKINIGNFYLNKYSFKVVFEDINSNYFDYKGNLVNLRYYQLKSTIGNTFQELKEGKYFPLLKHKFQIYKSQLVFIFKKLIYFIGI